MGMCSDIDFSTGFDQTAWYDYSTLHFDTSLIDLDRNSMSQMCEEAKHSVQVSVSVLNGF